MSQQGLTPTPSESGSVGKKLLFSGEWARLDQKGAQDVKARSREWILIRALLRGEPVHWLDGFALFRTWREETHRTGYPDQFGRIASQVPGVLRKEPLTISVTLSHPPGRPDLWYLSPSGGLTLKSSIGEAVDIARESGVAFQTGRLATGWKLIKRAYEIYPDPESLCQALVWSETLPKDCGPYEDCLQGINDLFKERWGILVEALCKVLPLASGARLGITREAATPVIDDWLEELFQIKQVSQLIAGHTFSAPAASTEVIEEFASLVKVCRDTWDHVAQIKGRHKEGQSLPPDLRAAEKEMAEYLHRLATCLAVDRACEEVITEYAGLPYRHIDERMVDENKHGALVAFIDSVHDAVAGPDALYFRFRGHLSRFIGRINIRDGAITPIESDADEQEKRKQCLYLLESAVSSEVARHQLERLFGASLRQQAGESSTATATPTDDVLPHRLAHSSASDLVSSQVSITEPAGGVSSVSDESALRDKVRKYLEGVAGECARLLHFFPKHLKAPGPDGLVFDTIRQKVRIVEDHAAFRKWSAEERARLRREGIPDYSPGSMLPEAQEESSGSRIILWDERAGERFHQVTILGDPGFGKSWLLHYEARQLADKAIKQLTGGANVDEIELPILVRLPDLQPSKSDSFEDLLVRLFEKRYPGGFPGYLQRQLTSNHAVLLMDAWDEVRPLTARQHLQKLLESFARAHPRARILVTSRIVGYNETLPPLPEADELELLAFNTEQISSFVRTWFGKETRKATVFLQKLGKHPQSRGLARIPLMLMLLCRNCTDGNFPDRRSDLYERSLRGLLFEWKRDDRKSYEEDLVMTASNPQSMVKAILDLLGRIALHMTEHGWQQVNEEVFDELVEMCQREPYEAIANLERIRPETIIGRLKKDGVLVEAGEANATDLAFLHLTFQEYLAARALAKRSNHTEQALAHVYEPAWNQTLAMLGGILEEPGPYFAALLRKNTEDCLCRPFLLAVQASGEAGPDRIPVELLNGLVDEVIETCFCWEYRTLWHMARCVVRGLGQTVQYLSALVRRGGRTTRVVIELLGAIGSVEGVPALLEAMQDESSDVYVAAVRALGEIGSTEGIPVLREALRSKYSYVRVTAAEALGRIGSEEAVVALRKALLDQDPTVRVTAAGALGEIGSAEGVPALLEALRSEDLNVHQDAMLILRQISSREAIPALLEALRDENLLVSFVAAEALTKTGSAEAISRLREALRDEYPHVRVAAAGALGRIGSKEAVAALHEALWEQNPNTRLMAAMALGKIGYWTVVATLLKAVQDRGMGVCENAIQILEEIGSWDAIPVLLEATQNHNPYIRVAATRALGVIGSAEGVPVLLEVLRQGDFIISHIAAYALVKIGSAEAISALLEASQDKSPDVHQCAARALGEIGSQQAIPTLLRLLEDEEPGTSAIAFDALCQIWPNRAVPILTQGTQGQEILRASDAASCTRQYLQSLAASLGRLADFCEKPREHD